MQASVGSCAIPGRNLVDSEFRVRGVQYLDRVADVLVVETLTSSDFFQPTEIRCCFQSSF